MIHRNAFGRNPEQFHQGQCGVVRETETDVCQIHKFPGNLKNNLQKKADCMVSYRYTSMQAVAFRKRLYSVIH